MLTELNGVCVDHVVGDRILTIHDHMARLEEEVKRALGATMIGAILVEVHEDEERDYWERIYMVASIVGEGITHRASIDSDGRAMLVWGHYGMSRSEALADMVERSAVYSPMPLAS